MNRVRVQHEHADAVLPMELARVERIDGLAVEHHRCACGHTIIVLSHIENELQGASWPIRWLTEDGVEAGGDG